MKLNMWMIANRLKNYEIELQIDEDAEMVLSGTFPYYAPGYVCITQVAGDILCESDQGSICIRGMELREGWLLIQGIFDWYRDWLDEVDKAVMSNDIQSLLQLLQQAFGNPVMLQDPNYCLIGMTDSFGKNGIPPEWEHIRKNGCASMEGYNFLSSALKFSKRIYRQNVRRFYGKPDSVIPDNGLYAAITFRGHDYKKLTVLESIRAFNRGDICLLEYLSQRMAIYMAAVSGDSRKYLDIGIIESLILGETVPSDKIDDFQCIIKGKGQGTFAVMLIDFSGGEQKRDMRTMQFLKNIIIRQHSVPFCNIIKGGRLTLLLYSPTPGILARQIFQTVCKCEFKEELRVALSCSFYDLSELYFFFGQAAYAWRKGEEGFTDFYHLATEYLMTVSGQQRICACEPFLRRMWRKGGDKKAYLETLKTYLEEERSSKRASERLYIHKNTLTYRIKFLKDATGWDLSDAKLRNYLRLSLYVLEKEDVPVQI